MTEKFKRAVERNEPQMRRLAELEAKMLEEAVEMIESESIKTVDDIPEGFQAKYLLLKACDPRRPTAQLKALDQLGKLRSKGSDADLADKIDALLEEAKEKKRYLRKVE